MQRAAAVPRLRRGAIAIGVLASAAAANGQRFVEVVASVGLEELHYTANPFGECLLLGGNFCAPERMAGGAAAADVDGDGDLDLAVTRLEAGAHLYCNQLAESGQATFADCTDGSGLDPAENGNGAAFGDADGDGDLDWFVTSIYDAGGPCPGPSGCPHGSTGNRFYRNEGDRLFSDQTGDAATGLRDGGWGWGAAFFD